MQILKLLVQSLLLLLNVFSFKAFFLQSFFFQSFLFEAFSSKGIKGSRNQTSCCETLTRRNLSATKSATYVHLGFPKILGAAVRREALLDNKKTGSNLPQEHETTKFEENQRINQKSIPKFLKKAL